MLRVAERGQGRKGSPMATRETIGLVGVGLVGTGLAANLLTQYESGLVGTAFRITH
jgi:hypothetical protein